MPKQPQEIRIAGIRLSRRSNIPLFQQLYEQLRSRIQNGQIRCGQRLPSGRELSKELSVSRIVVTAAYEQLIIEGYLRGKPGAGTFVSDKIPDALLHIQADEKKTNNKTNFSTAIRGDEKPVIPGGRIESTPFQIGLPSFDSFPYKLWHRCANSVLRELKSVHLGYEDTLGYWPLRKAVASYLRISRAVRCEAEQIIIVTGSQQGLNLVVKVLLNKQSCVWMEDPGYFGFKDALINMGITADAVPVSSNGVDLKFAERHYKPAKMVYVTPSYQFPLGHTLSYEKRKKLIHYARRHSVWILEDDYDSEFRYEGNPLSSLQGLDNFGRVIYSGTFSKVLFPGLRIAYLVVPDINLLNDFRKAKETIDRQSPILEQAILARFMEQGHFLRHIRKMRMLYAARQKYLLEFLNNYCQPFLSYEASNAGMHLRCRIKEGIDTGKFKVQVAKAGLRLSFVDDFAIKYFYPGEFLLGYTAFTKYQLKQAAIKLADCLRNSG